MNSTEIDTNDRLREYALRDSVERAATLAQILAIPFALYSVNSIDFIRRFDSKVSFASNLWPRLLAGSLPLLLLGWFVRRSTLGDRTKLLVWITAFSLILHASAWIHIWPLAISGAATILTYAQPANVFVAAIVFATIAPPRDILFHFTLVLAGLFHLPLVWIAYTSHDSVVFMSVLSDTLCSLAYSVVIGLTVNRLRERIAALELEKEREASRFLGPVISKAIFQGESSKLESIRCVGFVISIDIRDSTELLQRHGERWLGYRKEYFKLVCQLAARHSGYIQKTVGDCHVINFGVMDYGEDLSDLPGIESELERAEERRLQRSSDHAFAFVHDLFVANHELSVRELHGETVLLGAGIDKGWVERSVQGDGAQNLELDVNGNPVNCSSRLQEYSKELRIRNNWLASVLVVSPYATDYLPHFDSFVRLSTSKHPVRNFPGIRWVLVHALDAHSERSEPDQAKSKCAA